jgi:RNA polymerase sigma factor (TIGR02999 family)
VQTEQNIFSVVEVKQMSENACPANEITGRLQDWSKECDSSVTESQVLNLVYAELRRQAHRYLQKELPGHTLQTTALVHETFLKLVKQKNVNWESRSHFFGVTAKMMRWILIDYAKTKKRVRRGGFQEDLPLENALTVSATDVNFDLLELDEALDRLAECETHLAIIVELRFFSGLDVPETAEVLGVSESTVKRDWAMAKAWLHRELMK